MDAKEYQKLASRTLTDKPESALNNDNIMIVWNALGLVGEAGEVSELIKKGVFHQHGIDKKLLKKELGDVLWYISALCTCTELDLSDVMEANIKKLNERYPNGFSSDSSKFRND